VRHDIMPFTTGIDTTKIMHISRRVATVSGFGVQPNKAIVGKNAFAHESGIHQDGMLKSADTFEIMRPEDVGLAGTSLPLGKHSGRAALRAKLKDLGFDMVDNQLNDLFVRFKALADRKKEVFDDDLIALVTDAAAADQDDHLELKFLRVICGTEAPQSADITLRVGDEGQAGHRAGRRPGGRGLQRGQGALPQRRGAAALPGERGDRRHGRAGHRVSVRIEEDGRIATGQSADTDTVVASVKAYVNALNRLIVRREKLGATCAKSATRTSVDARVLAKPGSSDRTRTRGTSRRPTSTGS
jgi:2-isopropylmalate synthase